MNEYRNAGDRFGVYEVAKELGRGGMGIVLLVTDTRNNQQIALKLLGLGLDNERDAAVFKREAETLKQLNHPNIAKYITYGQYDELVFFTYKYINGISFRELLDRISKTNTNDFSLNYFMDDSKFPKTPAIVFNSDDIGYSVSESVPKFDDDEHKTINKNIDVLISSKNYINFICKIAKTTADALHHAHEKGVKHRDIKPGNLMIDRQGVPYLIDFGVARYRDDITYSKTLKIIGTHMYMSPEHITGKVNITSLSDIFSLGIVLYEAFTLEKPHSVRTPAAIMHAIATKQLPPLDWKNAGVKPQLAAIVHKATAKDPEERYQTAAALASDLQRYLEGKPVEATPYRHKLDGREISASRPMRALLAAMIYFLHFSLALLMFPDFINGDLRGQNSLGRILYSIAFAGVGLSYFAIGRGILLANLPSVKTAKLYSLLMIFYMIYNFYHAFQQNIKGLFVFSALIFLVIVNLISLAIFHSKKTRIWLDQSQKIRAEYRKPTHRPVQGLEPHLDRPDNRLETAPDNSG